MNKEEFKRLKQKCETFSYTSLKYTDYQDIKDYNVVAENDYFVLIFGYNVEQQLNEYHYAATDVYDLLKHMDNKKALLSFVPSDWVDILNDHDFEIHAKWNDFICKELTKSNLTI